MGNNNNRGGRAQSQRVGRQMAKVDKTVNNSEADDHMGKLEKLRKDVLDNNRHINKYREELGLPKQDDYDDGLISPDPTDLGDLAVGEDEDRELADSDLIVCIRLFDKSEEGCPVGREADGESFAKRHREVRRTRKRYREIGGSIVEVGKEYTIRKEKSRNRVERKRKATGVLKSIVVRLMPHEAEMAGVLKKSQISEAVDRVALAYQKATGSEIISAAVHRMGDADLHIHLQYSMVQAREEKDGELARRVAKWKRSLTALARATLEKEGHPKPSPVTVGKKKKQLLEEGVVEPKPKREQVWQKVKGRRSMRDDSILGYSFRQKLNIVRAAEVCGEHELAKKVALKNDHRRLFSPIARRGDEELNERYRDLWLERVWRNSIISMLPNPEESIVKLEQLGLQAARDYVAYGTTRVEATHLNRKTKELVDFDKLLQERQSKLKAWLVYLQKQERKLKEGAAALEEKNQKLQDDRDVLENLKKDAESYTELKKQVAVVLKLIKKVPQIMKKIVAQTVLWKNILKLGAMVGMTMPEQEDPEMDL